jgi:hypothetical protein
MLTILQIPGEVFWPTAGFLSIIVVVFAGFIALRLVGRHRSAGEPDHETLADLESRVSQLEQLQARVNELEERVDFTERILAKRRDSERLGLPRE